MHRRDATSLLWVAVADYATHTPRLVSLCLVSPYAVLPLCLGWQLGLAFRAPPVRLAMLSYSLARLPS